MITPTNLIRHELIGLDVVVSESLNPLSIGIQGKVIDETQQTLILQTKKGNKKILKRLSTFVFNVKDKKVEVKGSVIAKRPWERISK
jgi:ribonuclease P protein subunit POP4